MVESREENNVEFRGYLERHNGWVTAMQFGESVNADGVTKQFLISGGRDNNIIVWDLLPRQDGDADQTWGVPRKTLTGHSHFISDLCLSQDCRFALSSSWDATLRLWDISKGTTTSRFINHTRDVLSVAFSPDNRQIASGGRDKNLKIWNIMGECKYTVDANAHTDWVTAVRFHQDTKNPIVVSASNDKTIKVWDNHTMTLKNTFVGHKASITALDMSANYLASGSKDGIAMTWNVNEGTYVSKIDCDDTINCIKFNIENNSKKAWLFVGTANGVQVWDYMGEKKVREIKATPIDAQRAKQKKPIACTSLALDNTGSFLFAGFADGYIRVYSIGK